MRQSTAPFVVRPFQLVCVRPRLVAIRRARSPSHVTMAHVALKPRRRSVAAASEAPLRMVDRSRAAPAGSTRLSLVVPRAVLAAALTCLDRVAAGLVAARVSANSITIGSLGLAACAGVLLGLGRFGPAVACMAVASLGDALDGLVARRSRSASPGGALLDASADRYGEFFFLAGLAVYFHASVAALCLALAALSGSYMVSYGSAKAEAMSAAVPPGVMRRTERAICLCLGVGAAALLAWMAERGWAASWAASAALVAALSVVAVAANVSAVRRIALVARAAGVPTKAPRAERRSADPATARVLAAVQGVQTVRRSRGRGRPSRGRPPSIH
jgi:CDP-diacylglycerol--glycerol-3-phosphate 3-phosphatidyltransferase